MNQKSFENTFWKQYCMIEKEFIETLDYVELSTDNYKIYSKKYIKLILQIGSEIDNVFREFCNLNGTTTISNYAKSTLNNYPNIVKQRVIAQNADIKIIPFDGWNNLKPSETFSFWHIYNSIKHDRLLHFKDASLQNTIEGLAALFVLEMYIFQEKYNEDIENFSNFPDEESKIFILDDWEQRFRGSKIKLDYTLIDDDDGEIIQKGDSR